MNVFVAETWAYSKVLRIKNSENEEIRTSREAGNKLKVKKERRYALENLWMVKKRGWKFFLFLSAGNM